MYHLLVSRNCGITYNKEAKGETIRELKEKMAELDKQGFRWVVENEDGDIQIDLVCYAFVKLFN